MVKKILNDFFDSALTDGLASYRPPEAVLHIASRTINAATVTFSFSVMFLAPCILSNTHPDMLALLDLIKLSAQIGIVGGIGGAAYSLKELSQRLLQPT